MRTISEVVTSPPAPAQDNKKEPESAKESAKDKEPAKDKAEPEESSDESGNEGGDDESKENKPKKSKKSKVAKKPKTAGGKKTKSERKRGPARPYKKLPQETLLSRIQKLQKRIERTSAQAEDAKNFLSKYTREQAFREPNTVDASA